MRINRLLVSITNYMGLLLTFGTMFPPLGVALTITLLTVVFCSKIKLGRFLCRAAELGQSSCIDRVEEECQKAGTVEVARRAAWLLAFCSCLFYTLFIFDTLADTVGVQNAYWVLIVVPLVPVAIFCVHKVSKRAPTNSQSSSAEPGFPQAAQLEQPRLQHVGGGIELDVFVKSEEGSSALTSQSEVETLNVLHNV